MQFFKWTTNQLLFQACIAQRFELINSDFSYTFYISLKLKSVSHSPCLASYFVRQKKILSLQLYYFAERLVQQLHFQELFIWIIMHNVNVCTNNYVQGVHWILCFFLKICDFSELCQFCYKAGVLPALYVFTHWHRGKTEKGQSPEYFKIFGKNTIFNEHPVTDKAS